ncbi:hypothetical protein PN36_24395 [Candidatus Thiomargarita nelsonii]|uniref:RRXRR domain-containing protein n=1 Tax=Candidatus Thiomargarita nelsonii TaxID=1003181 RepID=A0A4E0RFJ1_9GAMM|nr:hypothetical protein PN36_24395 [Candidatus Thiomargarita nelsonii]
MDYRNLRSAKHHCVTELAIIYNSNLIQSAYRKACDTRTAVIKKRIKGEKAEMSFMSRNEVAERPMRLSNILLFLDYQLISKYSLESIEPTKSEALSIVALDPGVRTFQTTFSGTDAISYGAGFVNDRLVPLMLELDGLLSARDKLPNEVQYKQWVKDMSKNLNRRIHRVRARQENLVDDLHRRVAYDLVSSHDVILLPTFETLGWESFNSVPRKKSKPRYTWCEKYFDSLFNQGDRWFITPGSLLLKHNQSRFLWFWRFKVRVKIVKGFQTGDIVKAVVTKGKKIGTYIGRVAVRASCSFNVSTKNGTMQGISWKYCQRLQSVDGYNYLVHT